MICDAQTGQSLLTLKARTEDPVFLRDGKRIVTKSAAVWVWDAATGFNIDRFGDASGIAVSADGHWIVASWFSQVQIWSADTYELSRTLYSPQDYSPGVAISPDGKRPGCLRQGD